MQLCIAKQAHMLALNGRFHPQKRDCSLLAQRRVTACKSLVINGMIGCGSLKFGEIPESLLGV